MTSPLRRATSLGDHAASLAGRAAVAPFRLPAAAVEAAANSLIAPVRDDLRRSVRKAVGVPPDPPPRVSDPDRAFLPPGGMARTVHGDLPSMVIGGLAALLLQTLHPLAMAGVAEHSNYKQDAVERLRRTAVFVGTTTFGTMEEAEAALDEVRRVHRRIHGVAPDGRRYSANDPELLTWVHVAEMWCFLAAAQRYGPRRLTAEEEDRYFDETAVVATSLGARWVPRSAAEARAYFLRVRPELYAGPQAMEARDFLLRGVSRRPNDRAVHAAIAAAAVGVLPRWARRELRIPVLPLVDGLVVTPIGRTLCSAVRWTVNPPRSAR